MDEKVKDDELIKQKLKQELKALIPSLISVYN